MNETEAKKLTERIVGTWPASPKGFVWTEELLRLDANLARSAVSQLTQEVEEARLPVARFLAVYRAIERRGNTHRQHDLDGTRCGVCEGEGMVTVWEGVGVHEYSAVVPCQCPLGNAARATLARIIEHNDAELKRTNPHRARTYVRLPGPPMPGPLRLELDT